MTKKLDTARIAALATRIEEHKAAIAKLEAEIYAVLGLEPPAAPEKPARKPRSDAGRRRERPNVLPAVEGVADTAANPNAAMPASAVTDVAVTTKPADLNAAMPDHDSDRTPPDRDDPGPMPPFLRRDKPVAERADAAVEALEKR